MARNVPLICPSGKAKYFLFQGLTRLLKIRNDLPGFAKATPGAAVGLFRRTRRIRLAVARGASSGSAVSVPTTSPRIPHHTLAGVAARLFENSPS
jgi:hypothetical protein